MLKILILESIQSFKFKYLNKYFQFLWYNLIFTYNNNNKMFEFQDFKWFINEKNKKNKKRFKSKWAEDFFLKKKKLDKHGRRPQS